MTGPEPRGGIRIDAHHHLWDIASGRYAWPTPAEGSIYRTFTIEDLEPEVVAAGIDGTVLVQTVDTLDDTDSMLAVADRHPFVHGVVGWVPLTDMRALEHALEARPHPRLRGIRHLIHHEPDPEWLLRTDVAAGLAMLARRRMAFDIVAVFPNHLRLIPALADRLPDLTLVLDHLAKPPYRADGWERWEREVRSAAARPNVVAKISGLDTAAGPAWTVDELRPGVDVALDAFGPERLMFGSDWPVCLQVSSYAHVVRAMQALVADLSLDERAAVEGGTATRIYGLEAFWEPGGGARSHTL